MLELSEINCFSSSSNSATCSMDFNTSVNIQKLLKIIINLLQVYTSKVLPIHIIRYSIIRVRIITAINIYILYPPYLKDSNKVAAAPTEFV